MNFSTTQYGFIHTIITDTDRLERLFEEVTTKGIISKGEYNRWCNDGYRKNECMKLLLNRLSVKTSVSGSNDLNYLFKICEYSQKIRRLLNRSDIWKTIFSTLPLPLSEPVTICECENFSRCNYGYLLNGKDNKYFVRYHDPIGRDFIQRHEPAKAIIIYCIVENMIRINLQEGNQDSVVKTLFPNVESKLLEFESVVQEDQTNIIQMINSRIIVQRNYLIDHFVLADYPKEHPRLTVEDVVNLFVRPLAQLHSKSSNLAKRADNPRKNDKIAMAFRPYRKLLRFSAPEEYYTYLNNQNWLNRSIQRSVKESNSKDNIWLSLIKSTGCKPNVFVELCKNLWKESAQAMASYGSLVHLDHNPKNCFINKHKRTKNIIFDFDYLAITDPAYNIGLSISSIINLLLKSEGLDSKDEILEIVSLFFKLYWRYFAEFYNSHRFTPNENIIQISENLLSRSKAFVGIIIAAILDENHRKGTLNPNNRYTMISEKQNAALIATSKELLFFLSLFNNNIGMDYKVSIKIK